MSSRALADNASSSRRRRGRGIARAAREANAAVREAFARLRENGVAGDDDALASFLEAADYDVERAIEMFQSTAGSRHCVKAGASDEAPLETAEAGNATVIAEGVERKRTASSETEAADSTPKNAQDADVDESATSRRLPEQRARYAKAASATRCLASQISYLYSKQGSPVGIHYEVASGDAYDVDVGRMEQTHQQSGHRRRVRRERPGHWLFAKQGSRAFGKYPQAVCRELEKVFLGLTGHCQNSEPADSDTSSFPNVVVAPEKSAVVPKLELQDGVSPSAFDIVGLSLEAAIALERSLQESSLSLDATSAMSELLFSTAESGRRSDAQNATALLKSLVQRHGFRCDVNHVRRAGLVAGSMQLLQVALQSAPSIQLVGEDIFDRKYPKLKLNDVSRKNCIRCLLSRGMHLGNSSVTPVSKLLRKIDADATPQWAARWLNTMMTLYPQMPEAIRTRVCIFLGLEVPN
eukprot:TRINITY_DN65949_c0_g1_i1.p1 TRINITY_DN65949_c0_g1~~TRINITY_DN65949_c0_g1_i1.p1  ORF type:complete len:467 (-),score=54.52 TRINITY_DN65949_c0_g1_i1:725-2125(-)